MTFWQPPFAPKAFFPNQGERAIREIREKFKQFEEDVLTSERLDLVEGLAGNSPFLEKLMVRQYEFLHRLLKIGPSKLKKHFFDDLEDKLRKINNLSDLKNIFRVAKAQLSLLVGGADISREWNLDEITGTLSRFADLALKAGSSYLLFEQMELGNLKWPNGESENFSLDIGNSSGFVVLALGKLGGRELNYSSDVDLIILYDEMTTPYIGKKSPGELFTKLTKNLVRFMDERTPEGYIFRTDLRLRPDPGATPLAMSMGAAEAYYQSIGQNWERSAMIKARVCAGDHQSGIKFLERLKPFIWRKNLDYAAIADIHAIKARVHEHHQHKEIAVNGHDIKLSRGGIREIEFQAQIPQLIYGGRDWRLRSRPTIEALKAVCKSGRLPMNVFFELEASYIFFRTIEHRLQMINDEQTHQIPIDDEGVLHLSTFLGFLKVEDFRKKLLHSLIIVNNHYATLPGAENDETSSGLSLEALKEKLYELNFKTPDTSVELIKKWRSGRYRALKTDKARGLLEDSLLNMLEAFANTSNPDKGLLKFDEFISRLPAGVQLFSLLQANSWLFRVLARIIGSSPLLANQLSRRPQLLDSVLDPGFFDTLPNKKSLKAHLENSLKLEKDLQDKLDIFRRWLSDFRFEIGVHMIESLIDISSSGKALTNLADIVLEDLLPVVQKDFEEKNGIFPGGELALIAMGSYGGKNLSYTSDLDLILLYSTPEGVQKSQGKEMAPSQYYSRLGNHVITGITAMTGEGQLYELDLRLRPSGSAGPIVVTLETFKDYQKESAWIWEHMALTRSRVVIGSPNFKEKIENVIEETLTLKRNPEQLLKRVFDMRERLEGEFGTENIWDVKQVRGGLQDAEFICQYLQLLHGHNHPNVFSKNLKESFKNLFIIGALGEEKTEGLITAHEFQLTIQGILRLCYKGEPKLEEFSQELRFIMADSVRAENIEALKTQLEEAQSLVYAIYKDIIEKPAQKILNNKEN